MPVVVFQICFIFGRENFTACDGVDRDGIEPLMDIVELILMGVDAGAEALTVFASQRRNRRDVATSYHTIAALKNWWNASPGTC